MNHCMNDDSAIDLLTALLGLGFLQPLYFERWMRIEKRLMEGEHKLPETENDGGCGEVDNGPT